MKVLVSKYHIWSMPMVQNTTVMDQVNGNINAIHDNSLESTEFVGHFCPFDLEELELKVCKITDHHEGQDNSRLDENRRQVTQSTPSLQQPLQHKPTEFKQQLRLKFKTEKYGQLDRYGIQLTRLQSHTYSWEYSLFTPCRYCNSNFNT